MEQFERIRRDQREEGLSIRELARRHSVHRRAVRQALASATPPAKRIPPREAPALGPHKATIRAWLIADQTAPRKQRHTARRIWQRLLAEYGAQVGESTVRIYVSEVRAELACRVADVPIVALHEPGEEAEVDFGGFEAWLDGIETHLSLFHMRLSASGKAAHVAYPTEAQEAFLDGHAVAFARLGGVPARIRYDNLKSAVAKVLIGRDRAESPRFVELRSHYGFDSFYCQRGLEGAHEKGGVEGDVGRFRRTHLVPRPQARNIGELNAMLEAADQADDRRHVAGRALCVGEAAAAEAPSLRALPPEPYDPALMLRVSVDAKSRVCVRQSFYSVPVRLVGRRLTVALGARSLDVFAEGTLVARHERSAQRGSQNLHLDHYLEVLERKPGALPGSLALAQARAGGVFTDAHERFWKRARRRCGDAAGTRALIEVLLLHRGLPFGAVHAALDAVNSCGSVDPALVAIEARRIAQGRSVVAVPMRSGLTRFDRPAPILAGYDALLGEAVR